MARPVSTVVATQMSQTAQTVSGRPDPKMEVLQKVKRLSPLTTKPLSPAKTAAQKPVMRVAPSPMKDGTKPKRTPTATPQATHGVVSFGSSVPYFERTLL